MSTARHLPQNPAAALVASLLCTSFALLEGGCQKSVPSALRARPAERAEAMLARTGDAVEEPAASVEPTDDESSVEPPIPSDPETPIAIDTVDPAPAEAPRADASSRPVPVATAPAVETGGEADSVVGQPSDEATAMGIDEEAAGPSASLDEPQGAPANSPPIVILVPWPWAVPPLILPSVTPTATAGRLPGMSPGAPAPTIGGNVAAPGIGRNIAAPNVGSNIASPPMRPR